MHSSPSLRPCPLLAAAVIASIALASFGCSDSSEPEHDTPGTATPSDAAAKSDASSPATDASRTAENMTQVGTPPKRPMGPNMPDAGTRHMDEDASAPPGMERDDKGSQPGMPAMPASNACMTDSDCKTFDSMCGSCRCLVMSKQTEPPGCSEPTVMCVVAPCLNKRAVCKSNMCALKDVSPNSI